MLKLGKLTDYAITVMSQMAGESTARSAGWLASQTGVPEPTVAKVLKMLARAELLVSERGAGGGYRLRDAPQQISVGRIIEAMDGPIAIVSCVDGGDDSCAAQARCPVKGKWEPVNTAIRAALHAVRLSDMAPEAAGAKLYQVSLPQAAPQEQGETHAGHK